MNILYHIKHFVTTGFVCLVIFMSTSGMGQSTARYDFTTVTNGSLADMSTGTTAYGNFGTSSYKDNTASTLLTFPNFFSFNFMGVTYTQCSVNSNGQMRLGSTTITSGPQSPAAGVVLIAPISGDNAIQSTGKVHYKFTGTAPYRAFITEWLNIRIPAGTGTPATNSLIQVILYETTGKIEFKYGRMYNNSGTALSYGIFFSTGVTAGTIGQITDITGTPTYNSNSTSLTTSSFGATSDMTYLNSTADLSRRVFTFTPVSTSIISNVVVGNWSASGTWVGGIAPTHFDNVTIADGATITIDATSANCANLNVGQGGGSAAVLKFDATSRTLTVCGNLTVATNGNFNAGSSSTPTHTLKLGGTTNLDPYNGNLTVNGSGTLNFYTSGGGKANITFNGSGDASISGTGTIDLNTGNTLNKGNVTANAADNPHMPVLDIPRAFTVQDAGTIGFIFAHTSGVLKVSGSFTQSNPIYFSSSYTIPTTGGLWLNNSAFTVVGQAGSSTNNGLLKITNGIYNIGTVDGNALGNSSGSVFIFEGGTTNIACRINAQNSCTLIISGGIINVCTSGNSLGNTPTFGFDEPTNVVEMSGGTINLLQNNSGVTQEDYLVNGTNPTITGGILNVGLQNGNQTFCVEGIVPELNIRSRNTVNFINIFAINPVIYLATTINPSSTLNLNGKIATFRSTITNNGALTANATGSTLILQGSDQQMLGGTITSSQIYNLTIYNPAGVILSSPLSVQKLTLTSGILTTSATNLLTVTSTTVGDVSRTSGYVRGPMVRRIPASSGGTLTYLLPIGKSAYTPFEVVNPVTTASGTVDVMAEVFDADCGGIPGTGMGTLNTDRYWSAGITAGESYFTSTTVKVTNATTIPASKLLGRATTQGGYYNLAGSTIAGATLLSGSLTSLGFFAIGDTPLTWTGATNNNWGTPTNWTPTGPPGESTTVIIPDVSTDPIVDNDPATFALCKNITIQNLATLTIGSGKALTVTGNVTNLAGADGLVVSSGGSLIQSSSNISARVQRDVSAWGTGIQGWHLLSSPVVSQAIPGFNNVAASGFDFYAWWEPTEEWVNYKNTTIEPSWNTANVLGVASGEGNFIPGKGYLVNYAVAATKQFTGTLNKDNVAISNLTVKPGTDKGWHLLGNPFPSSLTWGTGWSLNNIIATAKIWQETTAAYVDIPTGGIIPPLNGFMVQVSPGFDQNNSLTIPASGMVHNSASWYKTTENPSVVLVVSDPMNQTAQESIIRFDNGATASFDPGFDSHFLPGYAPLFYSLAGEEKLSTNVLPEVGGNVQIPFQVVTTDSRNLNLKAESITGIRGPVILHDLKTNGTCDLTVNPLYLFSTMANDDPNRFTLSFSHVGLQDSGAGNLLTISTSGHSVRVNHPGGHNGTLTVFNMVGQLVLHMNISDGQAVNFILNCPSGYYLVKVLTDQQVQTEKIFID
ncbi:MAG: T9SS type A sorting domain-containing protein [Bacteroidales bacterium]